MRTRVPFACTALLLGACWSPSEPGRPRTPLQVLQRPLEPDLTTASFAARVRRLSATTAWLTTSPARLARSHATATHLVGNELARSADLLPATGALLHDETQRVTAGTATATRWLHGVVEPGGDRTHHGAVTARLLQLDRPPLGEIGDRRHRTDPDDDRPEPSLLERLRRRLRL